MEKLILALLSAGHPTKSDVCELRRAIKKHNDLTDRWVVSSHELQETQKRLLMGIVDKADSMTWLAMPYGPSIRHLRKSKGITQVQLLEILSDVKGFAQSALSRLERGTWVPNRYQRQRLHEALGATVTGKEILEKRAVLARECE